MDLPLQVEERAGHSVSLIRLWMNMQSNGPPQLVEQARKYQRRNHSIAQRIDVSKCLGEYDEKHAHHQNLTSNVQTRVNKCQELNAELNLFDMPGSDQR